MDFLKGIWHLAAAADTDSEIEFVESSFSAEFACLSAPATDLLDSEKSTSGMILEITDEMRFEQRITGNPSVMWYDVEGVYSKTITPFNGKCFSPRPDGRLYLISDDRPNWATPKDEAKLPYFRYDDSATVICDFIEPNGEALVRTTNVLTDGSYLSHIMMRYERP